jgi:hypothetical protein
VQKLVHTGGVLKDPIDELKKKKYQTGKIDDYIKNYERARPRVVSQYSKEEYYLFGFLSG